MLRGALWAEGLEGFQGSGHLEGALESRIKKEFEACGFPMCLMGRGVSGLSVKTTLASASIQKGGLEGFGV